MELQCGYCGSTFVGTESIIEHIKDAHPPSKVRNKRRIRCARGSVEPISAFPHVAIANRSKFAQVKYNDVEVCFVNDLSGVAFKTKAAYVDNFVRAHVYRKVGNDFHRTAAPPEQPGGDCLGVLHRCNFCQVGAQERTNMKYP